MDKSKLTYSILPCVLVGVTLFSFLSIASLLGNYNENNNRKQKKPNKKRSSSNLTNNGISNLDLDNDQNYEIEEDQDALQELNEILQSSSRRKDLCNNISNRYPVTSRISHVVEAIKELRLLQAETESLLEEQKLLTQKEKETRMRVEESLKAESKLREEAENNIQIYQGFIKQMRNCGNCRAFLNDQ